MTGPISIRLVGAAVALGLPGDPRLFGELTIREWLERRRQRR